jgi:hypothetical protein
VGDVVSFNALDLACLALWTELRERAIVKAWVAEVWRLGLHPDDGYVPPVLRSERG